MLSFAPLALKIFSLNYSSYSFFIMCPKIIIIIATCIIYYNRRCYTIDSRSPHHIVRDAIDSL